MAVEQHNPLEQFEIKDVIPIQIGDFDISFTNSAAFMVGICFLVWLFIVGGIRRNSTVPGRWQSAVEMLYEFIGNMLYDTAGPEARRFFPFVFSLFMFILFANLSGMIPYAFTVTSHIIVTFAFAALVFVLVTITGFMKNGVNFFKIFLPAGVPWWLAWLIIPIELISFLIRPMSLSVRLFANMMAGHIMLKVLAGFIIPLAAYYLIPALLPLLAVIALTGLEIIIAFLQAYVFAMLTCIYLTDAYHVEH